MSLTTDRDNPCLQETREDGQQECYLILSEEERAKGFIRPVRTMYKHVRCGAVTTMADAIAETYARDPSFYSGTFCVHCGSHFRLVDGAGEQQFQWVGKNGLTDGTFVGE